MRTDKKTYLELIVLILIGLGLYWPSFQFDFVNFDDQVYVTNNPFILNPSFGELINGSQTGNFHPMTMLSLWMDHLIGNGSPTAFHITSVILHIFNSILVYYFSKNVLTKLAGAPFLVAVLFCIHPMHIESVAWISSRKDLVYTFFYLISLISYFEYLKTSKSKFLLYVLGAGLLSLLSKPSAITLPFALGLLQYWKLGSVNIKKSIPSFILLAFSLGIGIVTVQLQSEDAVNDLNTYSLIERLGFALYGIFYYLKQGILPIGLSAMHAFPDSNQLIEWSFLVKAFSGGLLFILGIILSKRNKTFAFGYFFFLLNLLLTLQLISVGRAIVSERYTYLSYLGLFIALVSILDFFPKVALKKRTLYAVCFVVGLPLIISSKNNLSSWKNSNALWTKAIKENPNDWFGYIGRGNFHTNERDYQKALADYKMAVGLAPDRFKNYFNLGDLQHQMGNTEGAISSYSKAIELNPEYEEAFINRGQFYIALNDGNNALQDFNTALKLNPSSHLAYNNRGNLYLLSGQTEAAISDFNKSIELNPTYAQAWYNRGTSRINSEINLAQGDLEKASLLDPYHFDTFNNLGSVYYQLQDFEKSSAAFAKALEINPHSASTWLNLSVVRNSLTDYQGALQNAMRAKKEGAEVADSYLNQLRTKLN